MMSTHLRALLVLVAACGSPPDRVETPQTLPSASASASAPRVSADPAAQVRAVIPHMLELLARGEDERFIDEVVVPEEREKVLGDRTTQQLAADFKGPKHDDVVKMLEYARTANPTEVKREETRTTVRYEGHGVGHVTFIVEGPHVYIHD